MRRILHGLVEIHPTTVFLLLVASLLVHWTAFERQGFFSYTYSCTLLNIPV